MAYPLPDIQSVSALVQRAATELIVPRFRHLDPGDIVAKPSVGDPGDIVTVVDREVEAMLTGWLLDAWPGVPVVGEEATHADPSLLRESHSEGSYWLLDPIDGTKNFAAGSDGFGLMLAFVHRGRARAAWVLMPVRQELFVAEEGAGVVCNGVRLQSEVGSPDRPRGTVHHRYMPADLSEAVRTALEPYDAAADLHCAALEYTDILRGRRDFGVFYRLLPWDHVAPALILTEGGGRVIHLDGLAYTPRSEDQPTIVAGSAAVAGTVLERLAGLAGSVVPTHVIEERANAKVRH